MEVKVFKSGMKIVYAQPGMTFSSLPQRAQDFVRGRFEEEKSTVLDPSQTYLFDVKKTISEVQSQGYSLVEIELSIEKSKANPDGTLTLEMSIQSVNTSGSSPS